MAAGRDQFFLVGHEGARVLGQVFVGAELQRVDEDAGNHEVGTLAGFLHQGNVALVQVTHGRHEGNAFAFAARARHGGAQFEYGLDGVHAENPCSSAGKLTSLTAWT